MIASFLCFYNRKKGPLLLIPAGAFSALAALKLIYISDNLFFHKITFATYFNLKTLRAKTRKLISMYYQYWYPQLNSVEGKQELSYFYLLCLQKIDHISPQQDNESLEDYLQRMQTYLPQ